MSEGVKTAEEKAAEARRGPGHRRMGGPPHMAMGMPGEKSISFVPSAKRLFGLLGPHRAQLMAILAFMVASVVAGAVGPKILGKATDLIFAGFFGAKLPAGATKEQVIAGLRAGGQNQMADLLSGVDLIPGQGIDFDAVGRVLLLVLAIYVVSSVLMWASSYLLTGVVQRTMYRLREDVGPSSAGCRCPTSTASRAANCSAG